MSRRTSAGRGRLRTGDRVQLPAHRGGKAAITGDFVMRGSEVNEVIGALLEGGIEVSALHSHMLTEEPRFFSMHFWANVDAMTLAGALCQALSHTNSSIARR